jgi:hypothetical protein
MNLWGVMKMPSKKAIVILCAVVVVVAAMTLGYIWKYKKHTTILQSKEYGFAVVLPFECPRECLDFVLKDNDMFHWENSFKGPTSTETITIIGGSVESDPFKQDPSLSSVQNEMVNDAVVNMIIESSFNGDYSPFGQIRSYKVDGLYPARSVNFTKGIYAAGGTIGRRDFIFAGRWRYVIMYELYPKIRDGKEQDQARALKVLDRTDVQRFFASFHIIQKLTPRLVSLVRQSQN